MVKQSYVVLILLVAASLGSANLLSNGSFESGLTDWMTNGSILAGDSTDGIQCVSVPAGGNCSQFVSNPMVGEYYTLSFDMKNILQDWHACKVIVRIFDPAWNMLHNTDYWCGTAGNVWEHFVVPDVLVPEGASLMLCGVETVWPEPVEDMRYDNFVLTATPEPMTLSLLGLGGMALLRRRK